MGLQNRSVLGILLTLVLPTTAFAQAEQCRIPDKLPVPERENPPPGEVVNLRGTIVPIVDLRVKLRCASAEVNSFTVVIVLNVRNRVVGAVVDSVSDVLELNRDQIRPAPEMTVGTVDTNYITGIATVSERMLILMDIEGLMSSADMGLIAAAA